MPTSPPFSWSDLPNGLHDAEMRALSIDMSKSEVRILLDFWIGDLDATSEKDREARRLGELRLSGVQSVLVEPPSPGSAFSTGTGVLVDGGAGPYPGSPAPPDDGLTRLWIYVSTWNSSMQFSAKSCDLEWSKAPGPTRPAPRQ